MKTLLAIAVILLAGILALSFNNSDMAFHQDTLPPSQHHLSTVWATHLVYDTTGGFHSYPEDWYTLDTIIRSSGVCFKARACAAEAGGQ
jgi:hypothetical protein